MEYRSSSYKLISTALLHSCAAGSLLAVAFGDRIGRRQGIAAFGILSTCSNVAMAALILTHARGGQVQHSVAWLAAVIACLAVVSVNGDVHEV